jgi:hypothetical protein
LLAQSVTPARVPAAPGGLAALADLGVLTGEITPELVDEVIDLSGCREKRQRLLPARAVVYFVLGLRLFSGADSCVPPGYRPVMRWLTNSVRHLHGLPLPTSSALTRARQRLGSKPLELLFDLRRGPLAGEGMPGAFASGLRLVAWDGTGTDVADTPVNAREFGVTQGGNPQIRLLALTECGTRAVIDAASGGVERASEHKLARRLLHALSPGMLLLADRNLAGYELWGLVTAAGADMAWRIKKNLVLPPVKVLDDGSFLSIMPTPAENVRFGQARARGKPLREFPHGHLIRVIEYTVTVTTSDGRTRTEPFRLATTLLDCKQAPARQLAAIYHERREIEDRLRRDEDLPARSGVHPALQVPGPHLPGAVRLPHYLPGAMRAAGRRREDSRDRPRPGLLHRDHPCRPRPRRSRPARRPGPGPPPRHHRHHCRPAASPPRPPVRAG